MGRRARRSRLGSGGGRRHIWQVSERKPVSPPAEVLDRWRTAERAPASAPATPGGEVGGPPGPEPTRYGDWERDGRCVDF
ncbi:MAG: DUF1674 domain-containing protein [Alphaproteobacteria bacterium]|nr:DUF1674 domain-containing protein [Alphaproteobacteria bacterium]